jgi:hypothetical protein
VIAAIWRNCLFLIKYSVHLFQRQHPFMGKISIRRSYRFLPWAAVFVCLTPFVLLAFFNWRSSDDYLLLLLYRKSGFLEAQKIIFFGWTGRFTSTFLGSVLGASGVVSRYIFLSPLLFLAATWGSLLFLLGCINKCILSGVLSRGHKMLIASVLLLEMIYVQANTKETLYWFSSAVTYQTAVILFILLAGCLIRRWSSFRGSSFRLTDGSIFLLIILLIGTNEVSAAQLASFWGVACGMAWYTRRKIPAALLVCLLLTVAFAAAIYLSSGVLHRMADMNQHTGLPAIFLIILFRTMTVFYYIIRNPLFWVSGYFLFTVGVKVGRQSMPFRDLRIVPCLFALVGMVVIPLTVVLLFSRGSLPLRALDVLTQVSSLCLLIVCFLAGTLREGDGRGLAPVIFPLLFAASLLAGSKFVEACENCFSGYFYHAVAKDREQYIKEAQRRNTRVVRLPPFPTMLQDQINKTFPHGVFVEARKVIQVQPSLLPYDTEVRDRYPSYYAQYFGVDTVLVQN